MPDLSLRGTTTGFLLSVIDALIAEFPRYRRELKRAAVDIRRNSVRCADATAQRIYREIVAGYASVPELAERTGLEQSTIHKHLRALEKKRLIFRRCKLPASGRGGDRRSHMYIAL